MLAKIRGKRVIFTICFFLLCLIDQRIKTASGLDGVSETFRDLGIAVISVMILVHYRVRDFCSADCFAHGIPYLLWTILCIAGGVLFVSRGQEISYFRNDRIMLSVSIFLLGLAVIRTLVAFLNEHRRVCLNRPAAVIWIVMFLWMNFSRSLYVWPLVYFIQFGFFYLTDYSEEEREDLFQGMLNGVILAFFVLQGWCFVFRPYDAVRYVGAYSNCNMNALFYLIVLAAVLCKLNFAWQRKAPLAVRLFYLLGSGTLLGFLVLTISRTGWLVAVLMVVVALIYMAKQSGKVVTFFKKACLVGLAFVVAFPLVFCAVRFIPPMFHHPVWFWGEWSEEKVHSWDAWDSDKFVSFDKLMHTSMGRVADIFFPSRKEQAEIEGPHLEVEGVNMAAPEVEITPLQQQRYDEAFAAGFALAPGENKNPIKVRAAIYRYYIHLLNWTGHTDDELGFQMTPTHSIGHAHNLFLQYGVDFGIPVMVMLFLLVVWSFVYFGRELMRKNQGQPVGRIFFLMVPALFGMLEYCWGNGSLAIMLLFVIWRGMICDEGKQKG